MKHSHNIIPVLVDVVPSQWPQLILNNRATVVELKKELGALANTLDLERREHLQTKKRALHGQR